MENTEHVQAIDPSSENTVFCRITRNSKGKGDKAPVYRILVQLLGAFAFLTAEFPVFATRTKDGAIEGFSVAVPGGGFPALAPVAASVIGQDDKRYWLSDPTDEDRQRLASLMDKLKAGALAYDHAMRTGNKAPSEFYITL